MEPEIKSKQKIALIRQEIYSSPFPPPEILNKYKDIDPTFMNEIVDICVTQSAHIREMEIKQSNEHVRHQKRRDFETNLGQLFGFLICAFAILGGVFTVWKGFPTAGSIITSLGLPFLIPAFIRGRSNHNNN